MIPEIYLSALGIWFVFLVVAIINAWVRERFFFKKLGDLRSHQLSSILFIIAIFLITFFWLKFTDFSMNVNESLIIGLIWFLFTIGFEFFAGRYLFGNSWKKLLNDYNLLKGRLWVLVLLSLLFASYLLIRTNQGL